VHLLFGAYQVNTTRKLIFSIAATAICAASLLAQQTPSVDQILARYVTALGGKDAIQKINSRHVKGTIELDGIPGQGTAESFAKAPNKYAATISFPEMGVTRRGYDGATGWSSDPRGTVDLAGPELSSLARSADMYQALDIQTNYPKLAVKGTEDIAGKPAYLVEGDPGDGGIRQMYFDVASGLMVRNIEHSGTADAPVTVTTDIQDYRDLNGVKYPYLLVQHSAAPEGSSPALTIRITEVHNNDPIDDSVFQKPKS
jgi:hypothetical protein